MDKKTGYLLLALGVALILGAAGLLLASFYGGLALPHPFAMSGDLTISGPNNTAMTLPVPPQINQAANMTVFFMVVFLLVIAGARLGGLGVKLINREQPRPEPHK